MAIKKFKRVQPRDIKYFGAREAVEMGLQLEEILDTVAEKEIIDGVLIDSINFTSGYVNNIEHGLGRQWIGYEVAEAGNHVSLFNPMNPTLDQTKYVSVVPSVTCSGTLWVF